MYYDLRNRAPGADADVDEAPTSEQNVARIEVNTRGIDKDMALEIPKTVRAGEPFTVTVRFRNPTPTALKDLTTTLATPGLGADYLGLAAADVVVDGDGRREITDVTKKNQQRVFTFQVTAKKPGLLGLEASANNSDGTELGSALDAVEVLPATVAQAQ
jgi:hypothetical protein